MLNPFETSLSKLAEEYKEIDAHIKALEKEKEAIKELLIEEFKSDPKKRHTGINGITYTEYSTMKAMTFSQISQDLREGLDMNKVTVHIPTVFAHIYPELVNKHSKLNITKSKYDLQIPQDKAGIGQEVA